MNSLSNGVDFLINKKDCAQSIKLLHAFYRSDEKCDWQIVNERGESFRLGREDKDISEIYRSVVDFPK